MYHLPVPVPDAQTAGVTETVPEASGVPTIAGALVAAAAEAGVAEVSELPNASSRAAPMDVSFLNVVELVIGSMKAKPNTRPF